MQIYRLNEALGYLSVVRTAITEAEGGGHLDRWILEVAATLAAFLESAGADNRSIREARLLCERAMRLKAAA